MNVLFINMWWDAAGCSILQAKAINKHTGWRARHFRAIGTFGYETDFTPENYNKEEFLDLIAEADVIEFCSAHHHRQRESEVHTPFRFGFDFADVLDRQKLVYHDYNSFLGHWSERQKAGDCWDLREKIGYDAIFSSIPQAINVYKDCVYIPDVVDELSPEYTPDQDRDYNHVFLGHYPTGGGNNKNTDELKEALKMVSVEAEIIYPPTFHAALLKRKRRINLGFDALWRGFHGMTSVENMALGIPTICGIDGYFFGPFHECFGYDEAMPFIPVNNPVEIADVLRLYQDNPTKLKEACEATRRFALERWSFKNVAQRIVREYEKLL